MKRDGVLRYLSGSPNLRLLGWHAWRACRRRGYEVGDVIGEGWLAWNRAAGRWDPKGGKALGSWCGTRAFWAMRELLMQDRSRTQTLTPSDHVSLDEARGDAGEIGSDDLDPSWGSSEPDPAAAAEAREEWAAILRQLPSSERHVIDAVYRRGLTLREVGVERGFTESWACTLRKRALARLREVLSG